MQVEKTLTYGTIDNAAILTCKTSNFEEKYSIKKQAAT